MRRSANHFKRRTYRRHMVEQQSGCRQYSGKCRLGHFAGHGNNNLYSAYRMYWYHDSYGTSYTPTYWRSYRYLHWVHSKLHRRILWWSVDQQRYHRSKDRLGNRSPYYCRYRLYHYILLGYQHELSGYKGSVRPPNTGDNGNWSPGYDDMPWVKYTPYS